jgi:hypothetical protein
LVHANLHAYFKLASNTIQMIEGGLKAPSTSGGKRQRTDSNEYQRGSGSGIDFGSGSGHGSGDGSAAKRQKFHKRQEQRGGDSYGTHGHSEGNYGGSGGGGMHGTRGGSRHEYRNDKGGYYGSGHSRQQRDETTSTIHTAAILEVAGSRGAAHTAAAVAASSGQRGSSQENTQQSYHFIKYRLR